MSIYTFTTEQTECQCGACLTVPHSVIADGHDCYIDENGYVSESEDANLCLTDSDPNIVCRECEREVEFSTQEE